MKKRTIISRVITTCPSGLLSNILVMDNKNQKFIAFLFHLPILLCTLVCQNIHHKLAEIWLQEK